MFTPDEARSMADVGVDGIVAHIGVGGEMPSLKVTPKLVTEIAEAAHSINSHIFVLTHGGEIRTAADAAWVAARSPAVGCLSAPDSPREMGRLSGVELRNINTKLTYNCTLDVIL